MSMDPGTWSRRVAAAVRTEMAVRGRTVAALAEVLGVTEPTVLKRLHGAMPFDLVEVERVATWLDLTPSELLARADTHGS